MLDLRPMTAEDIALGLRLREQAGWNQTEADWRRFLALAPAGCFVAELDGAPVATTTTCMLGNVGWIAMVLVDQSARHRGVGTRLVEHAVGHLMALGAHSVRLDATAQGRPVYERLGFVADYSLARLQGTASPTGHGPQGISPAARADLAAIAQLDFAATGTERHILLATLLAETPGRAAKSETDRTMTGYVFCRDGRHATTIGPAIAKDPTGGAALLDWALATCAGRQVFVDIPPDNQPAMDWAHARGLDVQRQFTRMHLGVAIEDNPRWIWASSGPEKG
jgi:GNAT superfamily N-acetyltransferase